MRKGLLSPTLSSKGGGGESLAIPTELFSGSGERKGIVHIGRRIPLEQRMENGRFSGVEVKEADEEAEKEKRSALNADSSRCSLSW